jgi:hypothetical protein
MRGRMVLQYHDNKLKHENNVLVVYATAYDTLDAHTEELLGNAKMIQNIEFLDAPVYYKDIFNPQRKRAQLYRIYVAEREKIGDTVNQFWELGFKPGFTAVLMEDRVKK